eukprot:CAMPEP_0197614796 /NCGR_PEP_ID=MMETSP1326-20131121/59706_1 /TAXON_ID=1155430 /ORGANISM="Genus nov. species nov., Strain RCC2288" /LENGTH=125 /DNA_ID=CAMNT_0043183673 /DNA_START=684 /DNA_END=1057 /DNA_ORIENTATION=+
MSTRRSSQAPGSHPSAPATARRQIGLADELQEAAHRALQRRGRSAGSSDDDDVEMQGAEPGASTGQALAQGAGEPHGAASEQQRRQERGRDTHATPAATSPADSLEAFVTESCWQRARDGDLLAL